MSTLPPSGNAVPLRRLLARDTRDISPMPFGGVLAARLGVPPERVLTAASGAAALCALLRALSALEPALRAVALPAWCCPSVPRAVLEAGLEPVLVDMDPETLGYDPSALLEARRRGLLAIILVHFFGLHQPVPAGDWEGTAFIRDCAQDFDHRPVDGLPCVFSFGRGKALNAGHGGAVCIPGEGPRLHACVRALAAMPEHASDPRPMAVAINVLSRPRLYWALSRLPGLGLGRTAWEPLPLERISPRFEGVGLACLEAYASCRPYFRRLASAYRAVFSACDPDFAAVPGSFGTSDPWSAGAPPGHERLPVRFPVLARDPALREALLEGLGGRFGGVTRMYPAVLSELPGAPEGISRGSGFPGARRIAREILTLPIAAAMRGREREFFDGLTGILEESGAFARARGEPGLGDADWTPAPAPDGEAEGVLAGEDDDRDA